jgi:antitoxin ParD1/3/4
MAMETVTVSLDEETRAYVEERIAECGCESVEAYVAALVEADYKRWARENLEKLLLEGIESGPAIEVTDEWRQAKMDRLDAVLRAAVGAA